MNMAVSLMRIRWGAIENVIENSPQVLGGGIKGLPFLVYINKGGRGRKTTNSAEHGTDFPGPLEPSSPHLPISWKRDLSLGLRAEDGRD